MDGVLTFGARLVVALLCGGALGLERELAGKPAGLRTNILICVGAALLTCLSIDLPARIGLGDPARIAAQIVTGVGFLGAGTILQSRHAVHGLTSAAVIWVVAGIGMVAGAGLLNQAVLASAIILLTVIGLGKLEGHIVGQHTVECVVQFSGDPPDPADLLTAAGLRRRLLRCDLRRGDAGHGRLIVSWRGTPRDPHRLAAALAERGGAAVERWEVAE